MSSKLVGWASEALTYGSLYEVHGFWGSRAEAEEHTESLAATLNVPVRVEAGLYPAEQYDGTAEPTVDDLEPGQRSSHICAPHVNGPARYMVARL